MLDAKQCTWQLCATQSHESAGFLPKPCSSWLHWQIPPSEINSCNTLSVWKPAGLGHDGMHLKIPDIWHATDMMRASGLFRKGTVLSSGFLLLLAQSIKSYVQTHAYKRTHTHMLLWVRKEKKTTMSSSSKRYEDKHIKKKINIMCLPQLFFTHFFKEDTVTVTFNFQYEHYINFKISNLLLGKYQITWQPTQIVRLHRKSHK